jgi:RND family efflux transporter MFP subunit
MATRLKVSRALSIVAGLGLAGVAVYGVLFFKPAPPPEEPQPVRPLKSLIVGDVRKEITHNYPGKVRAFQEVNLAFQVQGQLIEFPVRKGQRVKQGDLLGRLDPRDYENQLAAAHAQYVQMETNLGRIAEAARTGAMSGRELTNAQARFDTAAAQLDIARKALEDTDLLAPFDGVVANTFVDNYENVAAKQPILSLQDVEQSVEIEVNVPEGQIALARQARESKVVATFDYLAGREFPAELREIATEADPLTQTYAVTFTMPAPDDVLILPGMTATLLVRRRLRPEEAAGIAVPIESVPVDGSGRYYVWKLREAGDGIWTVHRADVDVGPIEGESIAVTSGLRAGDRIAAAGVHLLQEAQKVRLFGLEEASE